LGYPRFTTHRPQFVIEGRHRTDHAERCLGHVIGGVRGVYDRHEYFDEKARAFEALAAQVQRIIDPQRTWWHREEWAMKPEERGYLITP